eukprot:1170307-Pyramimonas_sp.AAC.1
MDLEGLLRIRSLRGRLQRDAYAAGGLSDAQQSNLLRRGSVGGPTAQPLRYGCGHLRQRCEARPMAAQWSCASEALLLGSLWLHTGYG